MMYRKKPIVVEARQTGKDSWRSLAQWCNGTIIVDGRTIVAILIKTLEGDMWARKGDWIVKGAAGEFYPVKATIFEATFESVDALPDCTVAESLRIGAEVCQGLCVADSGNPTGTPCGACDWCDMASRLFRRAGAIR